MGLVAGFAKQTVKHERYLGLVSGTAKHAPAVEIKARYEPKTGKRYTETGSEINAEGYVMTEAEIKVSDKIEGKALRRVEPIISGKGATIGYEGFM